MLTAVERKWRFPTPVHQRVLKLRGDAQQIFVNGEFSGGSSGFWDYTIYVNPYMVVRPEGHYTKHIYVNSQRIASKIGNPEDYEGGDPTVPGSSAGKKVMLEEVVEENFTELFGSIPDIEAAADTTLGMSDGGSGGEPHQYWFTADHLGSSAFVTDASGAAIQHLEYMAFGEVFVDQRRTGFGTPYKFNAKELDCESGYYYYEARYYDPRMARFLSVDPLADKYPSLSPYAYVANNPLKYIDPDGRKIVNPYDIYKQYAGLEQQLKNSIANASSRSERRAARREMRANRSNIQGYNNYQEVQSLLAEFKQANESEYNRVDNLQLNGVEIDVVVNLSSSDGDIGQLGDTKYSYDPRGVINVSDVETGDSYQLPTKIVSDEIGITLYSQGRSLSTLANEFGDAIFGVQNPKASFQDAINKTSYWRRSSTKFSFDYQDYIIKGGNRPNPEDY